MLILRVGTKIFNDLAEAEAYAATVPGAVIEKRVERIRSELHKGALWVPLRRRAA